MTSQMPQRARKNAFSLMVSIPKNHPDMAKAAESGGADFMKVHLNVKHPASGRTFGSLAKERKNIEAVLRAVSIPVGVVPGDIKVPPVSDLLTLHELGIDFFDMFAHYLPLEYLNLPLGRMVCLSPEYTPSQAKALALCGAEVFEASVIPHEGYGKPVVLSDLARWRNLTEGLEVPLLVSTQRKIKPEECGYLRDAGARGVVIGVVVTGDTAKGVYETTKRFRKEIELLGR